MSQEIIVLILFLGAFAYIIRVFWKAVRSEKDHGSGCSHCASGRINKVSHGYQNSKVKDIKSKT